METVSFSVLGSTISPELVFEEELGFEELVWEEETGFEELVLEELVWEEETGFEELVLEELVWEETGFDELVLEELDLEEVVSDVLFSDVSVLFVSEVPSEDIVELSEWFSEDGLCCELLFVGVGDVG